MEPESIHAQLIVFFEDIEKYYGCKTEITEGLFAGSVDFDADLTTWNLSEFELIRSAYRKKGGCFMFEGNKLYYEISGEKIISFQQNGRHKFEFIEQYGASVFRITKIKFHHRY